MSQRVSVYSFHPYFHMIIRLDVLVWESIELKILALTNDQYQSVSST